MRHSVCWQAPLHQQQALAGGEADRYRASRQGCLSRCAFPPAQQVSVNPVLIASPPPLPPFASPFPGIASAAYRTKLPHPAPTCTASWWLRGHGGVRAHEPRAFMQFGAGPRVCPGRQGRRPWLSILAAFPLLAAARALAPRSDDHRQRWGRSWAKRKRFPCGQPDASSGLCRCS
jgi:hypothetical protein